jgi:NDP-sugar pyrophosphorylase family protein
MSKCLILAAGKGSRMENPFINKGLLPISGKAIISSAIENIICDEFIIAVGYNAQQIKDYCNCAHPNKKITYIQVDNYDGEGSGPGYSMSCCRNMLQEPFYITTADSYIGNCLPPINEDWIGVQKVDDMENYSTCCFDADGYLIQFKNKSKESLDYAFTGVMGVMSYKKFWEKFDSYKSKNYDKELEVIGVLYDLPYEKIKYKKINWYDIGRKNLYESLKSNFNSFASFELPKINVQEYTYKVSNKIIKLSTPQNIQNKLVRAEILKPYIPKIKCNQFKNVMAYEYLKGKTLYELDSFELYKEFLNWCENNLFNAPKTESNTEANKRFYYKKTSDRLNIFTNTNILSWDARFKINNLSCYSINEILTRLPWGKICNEGWFYPFHGDLNFGNIIFTEKNEYKLIDWRDEYESMPIGDFYYDLAKLYAGALVNFMIASKKDIIYFNNESIIIENSYSENTYKFMEFYENWLVEKKYDVNKVKLIAYITYLNMSPLHPDGFGAFLFYKGIYEISKLIHEYY